MTLEISGILDLDESLKRAILTDLVKSSLEKRK